MECAGGGCPVPTGMWRRVAWTVSDRRTHRHADSAFVLCARDTMLPSVAHLLMCACVRADNVLQVLSRNVGFTSPWIKCHGTYVSCRSCVTLAAWDIVGVATSQLIIHVPRHSMDQGKPTLHDTIVLQAGRQRYVVVCVVES